MTAEFIKVILEFDINEQQASSANMIEDRGTGLGLALVKSLCELHGGRLTVASQEGEGTTADVFLPLERD